MNWRLIKLQYCGFCHTSTWISHRCTCVPLSWTPLPPPTPTLVSFFFFNQFIYFNWKLITLQYCGGFSHTLPWISHGCTCVPHPEAPSHLPPHPIPLGCPSAPALSALFHTLNLDWSSISHMVIYMFQCYSLKSSHPCLLPQSPKVCFYICVSFAVYV